MTALRLVRPQRDAVPVYPTVGDLSQFVGDMVDAQFIVDQQLRISEGTPHLQLRFTLTRPLAYVVSNSANLILRSEGPSNQFVALRSAI